MYIYNVSLKSSYNEKYFRNKVLEKIKKKFYIQNFFPKIVHLWENVEEYCTAR